MKYQIAWSADRPRPFTDCATASRAPECLFAATVVRHMRETMAWFRRNTEIVMAHKCALLNPQLHFCRFDRNRLENLDVTFICLQNLR